MNSLKSISYIRVSKMIKSKNITPLPNFFTSTLLTISGVVGDYAFQNGNYVSSSSSDYDANFQSYLAYNGSVTTSNTGDAWVSGNGSYSISTGQCLTTTITTLTDGTTLKGEWLGLKIPNPLIITSYSLVARSIDMVSLNKNTGPTSWSIVGSNTGIDGSWVQLSSQNVTSDLWHLKTVPIVFYLLTVPTIGYSYYRIIILIAGTQYSYVGIKQFNLII